MNPQSLNDLINLFVESQKEEKGERTYQTYGRKLYVFQEYLERLGINDNSYGAFLHKAKIPELLGGIRYYVETYDIKYKSTTDIFLAALAVFFNFIQERYGIQNEYFDVSSKTKELKSEYDKLVLELKLNSSEQAPPLTETEYQKLCKLCEEKIDLSTDSEILSGDSNGIYTFYISSLATKFVLLFGTRNKILRELKISDYDSELNKVKINGYSVHLPDKLAKQMKRYKKIRSQMVSSNEDRLFIDNTAKHTLDNAKMFFVLKGVTGNVKAMSVSKYAIIQMLKSQIPVNLVMDFTGYGKDVCKHCQEIVEEENGIFQLNEKAKRLDSGLRRSKSYDDL